MEEIKLNENNSSKFKPTNLEQVKLNSVPNAINKKDNNGAQGKVAQSLINGESAAINNSAKNTTQSPAIRRVEIKNLTGVVSCGLKNNAKRTNQVQNSTNMQANANKMKQVNMAQNKPTSNSPAVSKSTNMINLLDPLKSRPGAVHRTNPKGEIKIVFLGGVGEIGKNMTAIEYDGQIIVIDAGVMFPSEDMPGIDLVIPDTTYLKDNADKVVAFLITHGHEDHIGAIPYVIKDFKNASVYSSRLTLALIENKFKEHNIKDVKLRVALSREIYKIGKFAVEFIDVNHSIADAYAIKISTPAGTILHSGDFKIDFRPIDGKMIDLPRLAEIGDMGVDLLLCESTNVERAGYTLSESDVGAKIEEIFKDSVGRRVFVATFSSNIYRIQQIVNLAIKYGRRVAVVGRSIENNLDAASKVGKFVFPKSVFIDIDKINNLEDGKVLVLCTGAQGEPASALSRLAGGDFQKVNIGDNDTIILSSSPIPGNESMVNRVINNLCRKGAIVIHEDVHASGHACQEELKTMHSLVRPKNFIPVHGEYRHLMKHAGLAESLGLDKSHIMIVENGNCVKLSGGEISRLADEKSGEVLIDGFGVGDSGSVVLRDRKQLSEDGIAVVTMVLNKDTRQLVSAPIILTRGLVYSDEADELNAEIQKLVIEAVGNIAKLPKFDIEEAKNLIRRPIRNFFNKKMGRMPVIMPIFHII